MVCTSRIVAYTELIFWYFIMNQAEESIFVSLIYLEQRERECYRFTYTHTHTHKHAQTEHGCVYSHVTDKTAIWSSSWQRVICVYSTSLPTPSSPQCLQILPEIHFRGEKCLEIW